MKASYNALRDHSKQRKIPFLLTFKEFEAICYRSDYMAGKGRSKESYTLDRIRIVDNNGNTMGYSIDNIAVITRSENSVKRNLEYDWISKHAYVRKIMPLSKEDNLF